MFSQVVADGNWALNTYAQFTCTEGRAMIGDTIRQCVGYGEDKEWSELAKAQRCHGVLLYSSLMKIAFTMLLIIFTDCPYGVNKWEK